MPRRKTGKPSRDWLFPITTIETESSSDSSLLDVVDSVLNKGAVVNGELILGLANVDLIYAKLSVLLSALDRITKHGGPRGPRREARSTRKRKHEDPRRIGRPTKETKGLRRKKVPYRKK